VRDEMLTRELDLPYGAGDDHAEGIGLLGPPGDERLLVVHDSPSPARLGSDGCVTADVVPLPARQSDRGRRAEPRTGVGTGPSSGIGLSP
jgi:hypothetical protein